MRSPLSSPHRVTAFVVAAFTCAWLWAAPARAQLCDPSKENCRIPLIALINNETVGIDVAFWFMEDARYTTALINRFKAGVPVRVLVDPRANLTNAYNADRLKELADAGIPMRQRNGGGILHWKAMIFSGQGKLEWGGANYSDVAFVPIAPYTNYTDEVIQFTDEASIVNSFMTKFDDMWTNTSAYSNYANITSTPVRMHSTFPIDARLNFPPAQSYALRAVNEYNQETTRIDVIMFRVTDRRHSDAMISAVQRGVPVRLIMEPKEYRDPKYLWDAWNIDRMYMSGIKIRQRAHDGLNHEKLVLLYQRGEAIYGSSNWTSASSDSQEEHNIFLRGDSTTFYYFRKQFNRKWKNSAGYAETAPFVPLPPDAPVYAGPANGSKQGTSVKLYWKPGPWAHKADVYFGTTPDPPLVASNVVVTPNSTASYTLPTLSAGKTYYWKIVSKTMANKTKSGAIWSFGT